MRPADSTVRSSTFISAIIRWRPWILSLWLVALSCSAVAYITQFRIDNSVAIWFREDDPELADYRSYNSAFGEREWTYVWLRAEPGTGLDSGAGIRELTSKLETLQRVSRVHHRPGQGDLSLLGIQNSNLIDSPEPYRIRLIDEIRDQLSNFPGIRDYGIVGTTVINAELNRAAKRDMMVYYLLITAFVILGGWLTLRRLRDVLVLCAVVLGTILPVMGCIAASGLAFNLMTVMLPTLLVTVSVSYLIHFISEFHSIRASQLEGDAPVDTPSAVATTFSRLLRPGVWTSLTTAIGFASLTVSPVSPIRHIGLFSALGIGLAWANTIMIAPCLLSLFWEKRDTAPASGAPQARPLPLLEWLARPRPILAALVGAAMLAGSFGLVRLQADTDYVTFFRSGSPVREDYAELERTGLPSSYLTLLVRLPEGTRISSLERHMAMRGFEQSVLAIPTALEIQSLDSMIEEAAAKLGGQTKLAIPALLVQAEAGHLPGAEEFFSSDRRLVQVRVMTGPTSTDDINEFRAEVAKLEGDLPAGWQVQPTGTNVLWANMDAHVIRTQLFTVGIAAGVLLLLLPVAFRSLTLGFLGFAVSFVPVLCTLGLMAWLGIPVNIATCILGGVVIGLAVDDTIYFLSRIREGLSEGWGPGAAAAQATRTTGRAMIKTSLILTGGFLTMTASDFMPSVYFGVFFAFSILVALLADLIVLPELLRRCVRPSGRLRS